LLANFRASRFVRVSFFYIFLGPDPTNDQKGLEHFSALRIVPSGMRRQLTKLTMLMSLGLYLITSPAEARTLGDFFKALGNSIAHPQKKQSKPRSSKSGKESGTKEVSPTPSPTPSSSIAPPTQQNVRTASLAPEAKGVARDSPYAVPVPGKKGFVTSPFAPDAGYIDVSKFPPGTEVKDPFSGKIFRTP
jgi:hypothetical protein